ncbi:UvrD-helicase domain-containing protein [bacterium]|nr:UvrD-helicase domain-containing protein [bacterium]
MLDLNANYLVEAGAGTGKTACLVERIAQALDSGLYLPEGIAAITFTRQAAGELRSRLRQRLGSLPCLFVGTIHALCARILRDFPLEAGLSPNFRELEEAQELEGLSHTLLECWPQLQEPELEPASLWPALQILQQNGDLDFPGGDHRYGRIVDFLKEVRSKYRQQRLRQGLLSFQDLLQKALELACLPQVQQEFQLLLVDEFQDTDPLQTKLLQSLSQGRAGSLFLVGDPKQSIYRFRRADIRSYQLLRQSWTDRGGKLHELNLTRRSSPALCAWLNRSFRSLFPEQPGLLQAHYRPMTSLRPHTDAVPVYRLPCARARQEAEQVAAFILDRVRSGTHAFGDFLVLTVRNHPLRLYQTVFQEQGIPIQSPPRRGPLGARASSLLPLLRHLIDPQDKPVLVGVLRGPLFGHSDRELYQHVQQAGTLRPYPPGGGLPEVAASLQKLDNWRLAVRWLPPGAALAYLLRESGLAQLAIEEDSQAELQGLLDSMRRSGERGLTLSQAVHELMAQGVVNLPPCGFARHDVVRLLTVHKAKGLEARVVILAAPQAGLSKRVDSLVDDQRRGYLRLENVAEPPDWAQMETEEKQRASAEHTRLLYVAATRAQETLVVSLAGASSPWRDLEPFLVDAPLLPQARLEPVPTSRTVSSEPRLRSLEPSWRKLTVSSGRNLLKPALSAEVPDLDARDWGHLLHSLLERAAFLSDLELVNWGRWYCRHQPRLLKSLPRALGLLHEVRRSVLGEWMGQAQQLLVEVPFGVRSGRRLRFGTLDLALLRLDGWGLFDYKTDRQPVSTMATHYSRQMARYAQCWAQLCGRCPHYTGLFSLRELKLSVDLTPPGELEEE